MPTVNKQNNFITEEEYLNAELTSEVKHEYIDGQIYAMAGASVSHRKISGNIFRKIGNHLEDKSCTPYMSDARVGTKNDYYYPDVVVDCNPDENPDSLYAEKPVLIVEVFSKNTKHLDKGRKLLEYINMPSVKEYIMIEQNSASIDVLRKSEGWILRNYILGEEIYFESINLTLSVEEIYHRVENEDMVEFLESKKEEQ